MKFYFKKYKIYIYNYILILFEMLIPVLINLIRYLIDLSFEFFNFINIEFYHNFLRFKPLFNK